MERAIHAETLIIWPVDSEGLIINLAESSTIQANYIEPCANLVRMLRKAIAGNLTSIYVRGSVAIGNATPPFSDLDLVVVTKENASNDVGFIRREILEQFSHLEDVDIGTVCLRDLGVTKYGLIAESFLSLEASLLWGKDISSSFPRFRPDGRLARARFPELPGETSWLLSVLEGVDDAPSYRGVQRAKSFWAKWSMRVVLRALQMLVMSKTGQYSNNLFTCRSLAVEMWPEYTHYIDIAYSNERLKLSEPAASAEVLKWFIRELIPKWESVVL